MKHFILSLLCCSMLSLYAQEELKQNERQLFFQKKLCKEQVPQNQTSPLSTLAGVILRLDSLFSNEGFGSDILQRQKFVYDNEGKPTEIYFAEKEDSASAFIDTERELFTYDKVGNQITDKSEEYSLDKQQWFTDNILEMMYDSSGNMVESISFSFVSESDTISDGDKTVFTFDENGNNTAITSLEYDTSMETFQASSKDSMFYDEGQNLVSRISLSYSSEDSSWEAESQTVYTRNESGGLIQRTAYSWESDSSSWDTTKVVTFVLNASNNPTEEVSYSFDMGSRMPTNRRLYAYDLSDSLTEVIREIWDNQDSTWVPRGREVQTYTELGWPLSSIDYDWVEGAWVANLKEEVGYTEKGTPSTNTFYEVDSVGEFVLDGQIAYIYDEETEVDNIIQPFSDVEAEELFQEKMIAFTFNFWDADSGVWVPSQRGDLYYTQVGFVATSTLPELTDAYNVYPVPSNDQVVFEFTDSDKANVALYNLAGQILKTEKIRSKEAISLTGLPNGVYIYQITLDEEIFRGKLVKE
ncbi:MAG: T9SS type A sorting domain-containing protein [Bacteroidota bacterium]